MIRVAVVEDDDKSAQTLLGYVERYKREHAIDVAAKRYDNGGAFLMAYDFTFDVVFMDIKMPGMDGMTAARKLRQMDETVTIIFVTTMVQYAVSGYEVNAFDYVVKPVDYVGFRFKFERALRFLKARSDVVLTLDTVDKGKNRMSVTDIFYLEGDKHYLNVYTKHGTFKIRSSMREAEEAYRRFGFARCSTSYLVNFRHVKRADAVNVYVQDSALPLSRTKKTEFMDKFSDWLGGGDCS